MAPEIIREEEYGREVDVWALGVITYVVLSGSFPFFDKVLHRLFRQIVERDLSFPDRKWQGVSRGSRDFIVQLLQVRPSDRPNCDQCLEHPWLSAGALTACAEAATVLRQSSEPTGMSISGAGSISRGASAIQQQHAPSPMASPSLRHRALQLAPSPHLATAQRHIEPTPCATAQALHQLAHAPRLLIQQPQRHVTAKESAPGSVSFQPRRRI